MARITVRCGRRMDRRSPFRRRTERRSTSIRMPLSDRNAADKFLKKLVEANGPHNGPVWSPDGRQIAFSTANGEKFYFYTNARIAVVPADGGEMRVLTAAFDEDPRLDDWGPDGIYFDALQKTSSHVFRLDPATLAVERLSGPDQLFVTGATFTQIGRD